MEAAWRLVAAGDVRSTTMRAIAAEAGVTTGSVTHYFQDKGEVLNAVLEHNNASAERRVHRAGRGLRGLAAVRGCAMALVPSDAEGTSVWRVWMAFWMAKDVPGLDERDLQAGWNGWRDGVRTRLAEAVADGELPVDLDLRYESDRIGTLVAGVGLVYGATTRSRRRISAQARRMLDDHLAELAGRS